MTSISISQAIASRLATLTKFDHFVGTVPSTPTKPYIVFYPAAGSPTGRALSGQAKRSRAVSRAVCVNNNPDGALIVADAAIGVLDGYDLGGAMVECLAGPLIADPDMEAGFRWSVTVEIAHSAHR